MARTTYSTDADIVEIRANILSLGVDDWTFKHEEAFAIINRTLNKRWYKGAADELGYDWRVTLFDPDLLHLDEVVRLACYKTLELAYLYLMNDAPEPDGFERQMRIFRDFYNEELKIIMSTGLSYDWDADDDIEGDELYLRLPRRLTRV